MIYYVATTVAELGTLLSSLPSPISFLPRSSVIRPISESEGAWSRGTTTDNKKQAVNYRRQGRQASTPLKYNLVFLKLFFYTALQLVEQIRMFALKMLPCVKFGNWRAHAGTPY